MNTPHILFFAWGTVFGFVLFGVVGHLAYRHAIRKGIITRNKYAPQT